MTYKNILFLVLLALTVPAAASALSIDYTYDPTGRLTKEVYSNGTVVDYTYDAAGNKTGHTVTNVATTTILPASTTTTTVSVATTTSIINETTTTLPTTTTSLGGSTTTTTVAGGPCPATKVLGANNPKLQNLRDFRDSGLAKSAIGRMAVKTYYNSAAFINAAIERSPALKAFAAKMLEIVAPLVVRKEE